MSKASLPAFILASAVWVAAQKGHVNELRKGSALVSLLPRVCFAKIPCALKIVRFPATMAASSRSSLHPRTPRICPGEPQRYTCIYIRMEEPGRLHDAALVQIRQPDRTG